MRNNCLNKIPSVPCRLSDREKGVLSALEVFGFYAESDTKKIKLVVRCEPTVRQPHNSTFPFDPKSQIYPKKKKERRENGGTVIESEEGRKKERKT
jgi:hypothetical protein